MPRRAARSTKLPWLRGPKGVPCTGATYELRKVFRESILWGPIDASRLCVQNIKKASFPNGKLWITTPGAHSFRTTSIEFYSFLPQITVPFPSILFWVHDAFLVRVFGLEPKKELHWKVPKPAGEHCDLSLVPHRPANSHPEVDQNDCTRNVLGLFQRSHSSEAIDLDISEVQVGVILVERNRCQGNRQRCEGARTQI